MWLTLVIRQAVCCYYIHTQRPLNHVSDVVWERPAHRLTSLALGRSRSRHAQQCMWSLSVMWSRASTAVSMLKWLTLRLDTCSSRANSSPPPRGSGGICLTSLFFMLFLLSVWLKERQRYHGLRQKKKKSLWRKWIAVKSEKRTKKEWGREERMGENREKKKIETEDKNWKKECRGRENYYSFFKNE